MLPPRYINGIFSKIELFWVRKVFLAYGTTKLGKGSILIGETYKEIGLAYKPNFLGKLILKKINFNRFRKKVNYELPDNTQWLYANGNKNVSSRMKKFLNSIERDYADFRW